MVQRLFGMIMADGVVCVVMMMEGCNVIFFTSKMRRRGKKRLSGNVVTLVGM